MPVPSNRPPCDFLTDKLMRAALHFVRFENLHDEHFHNAVKVFGWPDFVHRLWDRRAQREIADGDTVVFAKGPADQQLAPYNYDDSAYQ